MKTRAAVLRRAPSKWEICTVDLDEPRDGEVLVRMVSAGLCHTDDHFATGDIPFGHWPVCGGHEGAGVIEKVGPGVRDLVAGDHIVTSFIPICGRCRWCARGMQNLCDANAGVMLGTQLDGTFRMHIDGEDVAQFTSVSTFSEYSVMPEQSCIRIDPEVPLEIAGLLGCGVPTGWGSAVRGAQVSPDDVVIVMGAGGVGINAVQGARHVGAGSIIAVDPVPFKQQMAERLGATHVCGGMDEAADIARSLTGGEGADAVIICVGVLRAAHLASAFSATRKAGAVVVASASAATETAADGPDSFSLLELTMLQKRIQGAVYGMMSPTRDIPLLLSLWKKGRLQLEGLATKTYGLDDINQGYADLHAGLNLRGVLQF
jgi:NDMA-dependent alcohol dehydrogenase